MRSRFSLKSYQCQISKQLVDCAFASQRAMCETKRRILKKLAVRLRGYRAGGHSAFLW